DEPLPVGFQHVKFLTEGAVGMAGTHEANGGIVQVAPVFGAFDEGIVDVLPPQVLGELCYAPVVIGVLEGIGHGGAVYLLRDITAVDVFPYAFIPTVIVRGSTVVQRRLRIPFVRAFDDGISNYGHTVVAAHAPVVICVMRPYGEHFQYALIIVGHHG